MFWGFVMFKVTAGLLKFEICGNLFLHFKVNIHFCTYFCVCKFGFFKRTRRSEQTSGFRKPGQRPQRGGCLSPGRGHSQMLVRVGGWGGTGWPLREAASGLERKCSPPEIPPFFFSKHWFYSSSPGRARRMASARDRKSGQSRRHFREPLVSGSLLPSLVASQLAGWLWHSP